jgi:HlyD family secretion protein
MKSGKRATTKKATWRNRIIIIGLILLLGGSAAAWYFLKGPGSTQAQTSAASGSETYTTAVRSGDLSISASGSGKLVTSQSTDLSFPVSGTVTELNVKLGDEVKAGQVLASLGSSQTLEANLSAAELQVLKAQKALADLKGSGNLSLAQAYSDLLTAKDNYDDALTQSQKILLKRCSKAVTKQYLAALEGATKRLNNIHAETPGSDAYIAAKKQYDTALANYNYCASYSPEEKAKAETALDVAKTTLQEAQEKYDVLKASSGIDPNEMAMDEANLETAQAQLARAKDQLDAITLTSAIDGKVTYLAASTGEIVDTSKFVTIADVSRPTLDISVDESDLEKLVVGSTATVSFDALPDQSFTGKVVQVNPQVTTSGQYKVAKGLVELDSSAAKTLSNLPLGLSATVTIVDKEVKNALLAPVIALKDLGGNSYGVLVKGSDGQLKMQIVTIGIQDNDFVEITSGLKEGDLVSTGTVNFVAAGSSTSGSSLKNSQDAGGPPPGMPPAP